MKRKEIGVICSSGGGAFLSALACGEVARLPLRTSVVVDRECGMRDAARACELPVAEFGYENREQFSLEAAAYFADRGCRNVVMFYSRLVNPDAFHNRDIELCNVHPSLLPAFPGMGAVRQAYRAGTRMLGTTLHLVDDGLDTGPILEQVAVGVDGLQTRQRLEHLSYLQKVFLTLVWFERVLETYRTGTPFVALGHAVQAGSVGLVNSMLSEAFQALSQRAERGVV